VRHEGSQAQLPGELLGFFPLCPLIRPAVRINNGPLSYTTGHVVRQLRVLCAPCRPARIGLLSLELGRATISACLEGAESALAGRMVWDVRKRGRRQDCPRRSSSLLQPAPPPSPSPQAEGAVGRGERAVQGRALEKKKQQQQQQQQHLKGGGLLLVLQHWQAAGSKKGRTLSG